NTDTVSSVAGAPCSLRPPPPGVRVRERYPPGRTRATAPAVEGGPSMAGGGGRKPGIFAIRGSGTLITETAEEGHTLKKAVSATQLTAMGVGAIIGTGIFVVIGEGAAIAGPAGKIGRA